MSTKRTPTPWGEHVRIEPDDTPETLKALAELIEANTPAARIGRLLAIPELRERAERLELNEGNASIATLAAIAALELVADHIRMLPHLQRSARASATAAAKGRLGADVRWAGRDEVAAIIRELARQRDALGDHMKPSELWPHFFAALDNIGLKPREHGKPLEVASIDYSGGSMTYPAFKKAITRNRDIAGP